MTILDFLKQINAGGVVAVLVIILSLIEITPIQISPLKWIGKRLNKDAMDKVESLEKKVEEHNKNVDTDISRLESKLDEHIAQASRTKIMTFLTELVDNKKHTEEQFDEVISSCNDYEEFCKVNNVQNDKCNIAIAYIKQVYGVCLEKGVFSPNSPNSATYITNEEIMRLMNE